MASKVVLSFGEEGAGPSSSGAAAPRRRGSVARQVKASTAAAEAEGDDDVKFVRENAAASEARRSRAEESARRFHSRNMADIQRQAERGRKKRQEYEARREKIQNELNQENEAEERRAEQRRAQARVGHPSSAREPRLVAPTATDRDLELLDMQRERFFAGLTDSHSRQREQMEEYELALALSLSMAETNGGGASLPPPSELYGNIMFPTSAVSPAYGLPPARDPRPSWSSSFGARSQRAAPQQWETDGMSYEELCKLEDVKVTAPKRVVDGLETAVVGHGWSCGKDDLCSICQCGFEDGEKIKKLKCGHVFHAECCDEWLGKYSTNCPVCKERVS